MTTIKCLDHSAGKDWTLYNADCVEVLRQLPANSVDLSVYSPPFSNLYIYSESVRDMGNVADDAEFQAFYAHVAAELYRVTKPGRNCCIHVKDLVYYSNASEKGDRGLRDFSGDCIRTHQAVGWTFHQRTTIERDPVREMQKTKADRLLFKHFREDAARSGGGLPEYILTFRKWEEGMDGTANVTHEPSEFPLDTWQEWANPVWRGTRETDVLNVRQAKDDTAERHLCPMPLDLIRRCVLMWSNPGEIVLSPFAGIGSEGYESLRAGRRFVGVELKGSYFRDAGKNLRAAEEGRSVPLFEEDAA